MKRVLLVFGTRPEVVSLAPVYDAMKQRGNWEVYTACTAQHREILDQMLVYFDIQSNYDLNIMTPSQDLFDITSKVLLGLRSVLRECQPDLVIVGGGTASAMAAAMAAFYLEIPVAHIDAGLRTWDMHNPFPEEINGWIADAVSSVHFAPTKMARDFLIRNGFAPTSVHVTGSPAVDSLRIALKAVKDDPFRAVAFHDDQFIIL